MYEKKSVLSQQTPDQTSPLPLDIYKTQLAPLEATVKYLRENRQLTYAQIASLLRKQPTTISTTYYNTRRKHPQALRPAGEETVPLSIFDQEELTVAETIVHYLHRNKGLKIAAIAQLLGKDNKALWTTAKRAEQKYGEKTLPEAAEEERVPLDIFASGLAPLEAVVKHLREKDGRSLAEIARQLGRKPTTIATTYANARKKRPATITTRPESPAIPLRILADENLSITEAVVMHLTGEGYRLATIARLLGKDNKAIWTSKKRAQEKRRWTP